MRKESCKWVVIALWAATLSVPAAATSLRFFGNGTNDIDRVKIQVDNPANSLPGPPADIGATDFTIEFWIRGTLADNSLGDAACGSGYGWINGNIVLDRDRYDQGQAFGISLGAGRVQFGVKNAGSSSYTVCSTASVLNNQWRHVAVTRNVSTGLLRIFIDGVLDGEATGPTGDISFPDDGAPLPNRCNGGTTTCPNDPYLVIGAEKHDVSATNFPAFSGFLDELRLSTTIRYTGAFTRPTAPFTADANTAALYHFDEGTGTTVGDSAAGGASPGVLRVGGSPTGPLWSTETPFAAGSAGTVQWSASTFSVGEAAGSIAVTATRINGSSGAASVTYATSNGTATSGSDYAPASGTLSWADGDTASKSFSIGITNDAIDEPNETISLALSNATGAALGSPTTATVTIVDDDVTPQPGTLQWTTTSQTVSEGGGTVTLSASRTGGGDGAVSVNYATVTGSAAAGSDFTAASGTLNWVNGDTASKSVSFTILEDAVVEGGESFTVQLSAPGGGATLGANTVATVNITDNDVAAQPGTLQWTATTASVTEGTATVTLTASRSNGSSGAVSISYATAAGSAQAGGDFTAATGTLSWAAGDVANKSATISITNDTVVEAAESFTVTLSAPTGGATLGANSVATVNITDDDVAPQPGTLQWTTTTTSVTEGTATVTVTASRSGGSSGAVGVSYATAAGSAQAGSDFTAASGTLSWAAGDVADKSVTISIANDLTVESAESFTVSLSNATGGASLGASTQVTVNITDDDTAPPGGGSSGGGSFDGRTLTLLAVLLLLRPGMRRLRRGARAASP